MGEEEGVMVEGEELGDVGGTEGTDERVSGGDRGGDSCCDSGGRPARATVCMAWACNKAEDPSGGPIIDDPMCDPIMGPSKRG